MKKFFHIPVMAEEVLACLAPQKGGVILDLTLGGGGYAEKILPLLGKSGLLVGVDWDEEALKVAREKLKKYKNIVFLKENFKNLDRIKEAAQVELAKGILVDLGASFSQLTSPERGFSFSRNAFLDMRMSDLLKHTAADLLNSLSVKELENIFKTLANVPHAARISAKIVEARRKKKLSYSFELVEIIRSAIPPGKRSGRIHFATKAFQALRIAVNQELENLAKLLPQAIELLAPGGRIVCLSYHSGEDRIVKQTFLRYSGRCICGDGFACSCYPQKKLKILTRKPCRASWAEIAQNPSARSAKLRAAQKT